MDFRYLAETKNEFNNFLCGILVPHLYHGIKGMLKYSENVYNQIEIKNKKGAKIDNPGIIYIFKKTLDGISTLNNHEIEEEYLRIKNNSGCVDWFDNLVRASFKSYVLFLTWDPKSSNSKYSDNSIFNEIIIKDFIHKCYVISCNYFKENPEIFVNKNNKKEIFEILKMCIDMSIKKSLPYNQIIQEYLNIEFDKTNETNNKEIANIKNMVYNIINDNKYGKIPQLNNLIIEDSSKDEFINLEDPDYKRVELENFINQEKINQQNKIKNKDVIINSDKSDKSYKSNRSYKSNKSYENIERNIIETTTKNSNELLTGGTNDYDLSKEIPESSKNSSTIILSRAEIKNKEINKIIDNNSITSSYRELNESNTSSDSEIVESKKSSVIEILTSPPVIKQKVNDRLNDIFEINKKMIGGNKKNVKVVMDKNNLLSEKFDQVENFYDSMIKI